MKTKLIGIGLPENVADEIMDAFDTYQRTLKRHSKPKGEIAFQKNLQAIERLSMELEGKLSDMTLMERQIVERNCNPKIFALRSGLTCLAAACDKAQKLKSTFSRKRPFLIDLTINLWGVLERHGHTVTRYKNNILCQVLNTLCCAADESIDDSEAPEDLRAFHLLREASKRINKS